jgi:uncharacterized protein (TIGR00369 family)
MKMEEIIDNLYERLPYYSTIGMQVKEIRDGRSRIELMMRKELSQNGMIHGGVLASMVDASCACAAFSATDFKGWVTTIDLQVSFLKPVSKGKLIAEANCLRAGKNVIFCESKIKNEDGELICIGTSQLLHVNSV